MVTDQDPAPVCLSSSRGQAWLPENSKFEMILTALDSKPEVDKLPRGRCLLTLLALPGE